MNRLTFLIAFCLLMVLSFYFIIVEPHPYAAGYTAIASCMIYPLRRWYLVKHKLLTLRFWQIVDYFTKP